MRGFKMASSFYCIVTIFVTIPFIECFIRNRALRCFYFNSIRALDDYGITSLRMGGGPLRGDKLPYLVKLIESDFGNTELIKKTVIDVGLENEMFMARSKAPIIKQINGRWEQLWTTEKETMFILNRGIFGRPAKRAVQMVDAENGVLNNTIELEGDSEFAVVGSISSDAAVKTRTNFSFKSATIRYPPLFPRISLPPVGSGWFQTLYVNELYRLSTDSRGDYAIFRKLKE